MKEILSAYAALFASLATLFCCALPALLVLLGFGLTSVLTVFAAIPGWQEFGAYDLWLFPVSGALLALGFYFSYFRDSLPGEACAIPTGSGETACGVSVRYNRSISATPAMRGCNSSPPSGRRSLLLGRGRCPVQPPMERPLFRLHPPSGKPALGATQDVEEDPVFPSSRD